ncbi:MAG: hypothetical protein JWM55_671 [Acidimicrobiaceae bacterium]|nr:hypothetical protein [Acidimicrobiaceae bacterium]
MRRSLSSIGKLGLFTSAAVLGLAATQGAALAAGRPGPAGGEQTTRTAPTFSVAQILLGSSLSHTFIPTGSSSSVTEPLGNIDDITQLGDDLFVVFQNGVGAKGEPSSSGNPDSTVVELSLTGTVLGQWDVTGRTDGIAADHALKGVIVTVNEDGNSSLYVIRPGAAAASQITHYAYDAGLIHGGGTDSISVVDGRVFISASNPGTSTVSAPSATFPAVYSLDLVRKTLTAALTPVFYDEDAATVANVGDPKVGTSTNLALTDPDSTEIVPGSSSRFGGDLLLNAQGDQQQVYVGDPGAKHQTLSVLALTQSVDDTAWATSATGSLYSTDSAHNSVDVVDGPFSVGQAFVGVTPCNANSATAACPANYLATLDLLSGAVTSVTLTGAPYTPKGALVFVSDDVERHGEPTSHD